MSILNTLLALSLVVISVVKTADIFILSDRSLTKVQERFVKTTRELLTSSKGSVSLVAALLTAILSLLLLFYVQKMKIEYSEARYRKDSYLCMRYLNLETASYIKEMALFNFSISAAYAARSSVVGGVSGEVLWRGLTLTRDLRHLNYARKLFKNSYCQLPETLTYIKNPPFKTKTTGALDTAIDGTSSVRKQLWAYTYFKRPNGIRLKKSFCLKSTFQIQNAYTPHLKTKSEELAMADLSSLKCLSGPSS